MISVRNIRKIPVNKGITIGITIILFIVKPSQFIKIVRSQFPYMYDKQELTKMQSRQN